MTPNQVWKLVGVAVFAIVGLWFVTNMVEYNDSGSISVVQSVSGNMSVVTKEGPFFQGFGKVTTYHRSEDFTFCEPEASDCKDPDFPAPEVIFNDSAKANISGNLRYDLPLDEDRVLAIHRTFRSQENFERTILPKMVRESLRQTAALMKAEESYSSRSAEFTDLAREQIRAGIYVKSSRDNIRRTSEGTEVTERVVEIALDPTTKKPLVSEASPFEKYGVTIGAFTVTALDYDNDTDNQISSRKTVQQQAITARAQAETAKMNAIKAEEEGKANIETAKAAKMVEKIQAVTEAQKAFEVAEFSKKQVELESAAALIKARAEAEGNKLKVTAGLTPEQRAQFAKDTAIGVAEALAKTQWPSIMNFGGGQGSPHGPLDAISWESQYDLAKKMAADRSAPAGK